MVTLVLESLLDLFDLFDSTDYRKCRRAYVSAWKGCDSQGGGSIEVLREAFKAERVTRAYAEPDGPIVAPWLAAWREGLDPRSANRIVRDSRT